MRFLWKIVVLAAACLASSFAWASPQGDIRPSIRVQAGDWGVASVQDIESVLNSVAEVLLPSFPRHASVRIVVAASKAGPRVLAERSSGGAHQVLLSVRDRLWDQFAYQFAHELCHIASNYDQREIGSAFGERSHQWFEETLCEVVSLVALDRLASRWKASPPHAGWEAYAPAFRRYADRLLKDEHRHFVPASSVAAWYRENEHSLEGNPYLREKNELAATALLELFQGTPGSLEAIGYLNLNPPSQEGFAAYLASWYKCCPEAHRPFVLRLISLFGAV
ncbi:MAG: hypothetical protein HY661_10330 [Betaproteobacteria bacterium]|nr:hypothetical protein [Betaproteobacteria bacterium]